VSIWVSIEELRFARSSGFIDEHGPKAGEVS